METTAIIISGTPEDIAAGLRKFAEQLPAPEPKPETDLTGRMDRRTAAKFLGVCYQTMCTWTKDGKIREHGTGRKKFYLRNELIEAIKNNS
jgi:hypothetical protein